MNYGMEANAKTASLFEIPIQTIDGKKSNLSAFRGQLMLIVNTASRCGFTPQYKGLETVFQKYRKNKNGKDQFVVLGFPSNDFGAQEPGTSKEIKEFCELQKISFPLFEKAPVTKAEKQPVYKYLVENSPVDKGKDVAWNFEKFLVGPDGKVIARFKSKLEPESKEITAAIENHLP